MPQFDPANFAPQFVWLILLFALLYFGVVQWTLPRVGRMVEGRDQMIRGDIAGAEAAKAEADRVRDAYEQAIAEARGRAQAAVADAQARAAHAGEARLHEASAATEARLDRAMVEIADARTRATGEIARIAAEAAAEIVERVTGARPETAAAAAAVEQAA